MRALFAQIRAEVEMTLRRGETLLLTLGIPIILLAFFSQIRISSTEGAHPVDVVTPGILALAVMSTSMVSLGIATGFERGYGVLKRLGATPLGRGRLLAAKILSIAVVEVLQAVVIVGIGLALGWKPSGGIAGGLGAAGACVLGSLAFGGIGLTMAGRLRAEINLAAANGLYLVLLLLGGMVVPLSVLPAGIRIFAEALPAAALSSALHDAIGPSGGYSGCWVVLAAWAVIAPLVATATFRFQGD
jgi:ABC-2 type transport system permease protein